MCCYSFISFPTAIRVFTEGQWLKGLFCASAQRWSCISLPLCKLGRAFFVFFCARSRGGLMSDILFLCMLANSPVLNQWLDARLLFLTGHAIQHLFMFPFSFRDIIRKFWRCIVQYYQCCKQSAKHKYKEDMLLFILSSFISLNPFN